MFAQVDPLPRPECEPPVADRHASERNEILLFEEAGTNAAMVFTGLKGDTDAAFRDADYVRRARITEAVSIPTIGIGAGPATDGQVLVLSDLLGIESRVPRFARRYMDGASLATDALNQYAADVKDARFRTCAESYS